MLCTGIFEIDGMAVGENQGIVKGIVRSPKLHVRDVQRVANVHRIEKQERRAVVLDHLLDHEALAIGAGRGKRGERQGAAQGLARTCGVQVGGFARVLENTDHCSFLPS